MILILGLLALLFGDGYTLFGSVSLRVVGVALIGLGLVEFYARRASYMRMFAVGERRSSPAERSVNPVAHQLAALGAPEGFVAWAASQESGIWERCNHAKWVMWAAGRTAESNHERRAVVAAAVASARTAVGLIPTKDAAPLRRALAIAERWTNGKVTIAEIEAIQLPSMDAARALMWEGDRARNHKAAEAAQASAYCARLAKEAAMYDPDPDFKARLAAKVAAAALESKELVQAFGSPGSPETFAEWSADVVTSAVIARIWDAEIHADEAQADVFAGRVSEARSAEQGAFFAATGSSEAKVEAASRYQSAQEDLSGQRFSPAGEAAAGKASLECADIIRSHVKKPAIFG